MTILFLLLFQTNQVIVEGKFRAEQTNVSINFILENKKNIPIYVTPEQLPLIVPMLNKQVRITSEYVPFEYYLKIKKIEEIK